jgi:SAM-dependent methyltransferase
MEQPPQASDPREAAQIAYWNDKTAASWTALQELIDPILAPLTTLAIQRAEPNDGERALDIGSGCGATILELARRVGALGHVLGIDVSAQMSARARERIAAANIANAQVIIANAATYDFAPADRDLLFSSFGVMFFADPVAALMNLRRAMRRDGRLEWVVWRNLAENPWFTVPLQAVLPLLPPAQAADPLAPGPFAFADAVRVKDVLHSAGWRNVRVERHDAPLRIAAADDMATAAEIVTWVGPLARRLAGSRNNTALQAAVQRSIEDSLRPYTGDDGIVLTASVWLVSANA